MKPTEYLTITERPNTSITVMSDSRGPLIVASDGPGARAVRYTPDESAKFALAILEAAGVPDADDDWLGEAVNGLRKHIQIRDKRAAEAKDKAELEAEALELFKASGTYGSDRLFLKFSHLDDHIQKAWLAVARRAREMAKEVAK